jgi:hypothetical protein
MVRHEATATTLSGWRGNFDNPEFGCFIYSVRSGAGTHHVFVVWPTKYKTKPPKPNRLGWLPQMEFGALPGLLDPKDSLTSGTTVRFTYKTMSNEDVDLDFTKK